MATNIHKAVSKGYAFVRERTGFVGELVDLGWNHDLECASSILETLVRNNAVYHKGCSRDFADYKMKRPSSCSASVYKPNQKRRKTTAPLSQEDINSPTSLPSTSKEGPSTSAAFHEGPPTPSTPTSSRQSYSRITQLPEHLTISPLRKTKKIVERHAEMEIQSWLRENCSKAVQSIATVMTVWDELVLKYIPSASDAILRKQLKKTAHLMSGTVDKMCPELHKLQVGCAKDWLVATPEVLHALTVATTTQAQSRQSLLQYSSTAEDSQVLPATVLSNISLILFGKDIQPYPKEVRMISSLLLYNSKKSIPSKVISIRDLFSILTSRAPSGLNYLRHAHSIRGLFSKSCPSVYGMNILCLIYLCCQGSIIL